MLELILKQRTTSSVAYAFFDSLLPFVSLENLYFVDREPFLFTARTIIGRNRSKIPDKNIFHAVLNMMNQSWNPNNSAVEQYR